MNEHKVIGYEICYESSEGVQSLVDDIGAFYLFGKEENGREIIKRHQKEKPYLKKIRFKAVLELMDAGDSFTFDSVAWRRFYEIAEANNLDFPDGKDMREDDLITIGPESPHQ